ncbi:MAG: hypothetical protein FWF86_01860 [Clostridia bacterium]|nr:hypothetical protein [Clostridia bacterium]
MKPVDSDIRFFDRCQDAEELCAILTAYLKDEDESVPDSLLNRLAELKNEEPLLVLIRDHAAPCQARMLAVDLLRQMESVTPMVDYLRWQVERSEEEELLDNALESLRQMGDSARQPIKTAFLAAGSAGKEALLDVLTRFSGDEDVFAFALSSFRAQPDKRALFAGYLAKLDDDRALEALLDAAEGNDVSYIDFIEIRNAIERLGGEAPLRDFTADPTFRAVKRLQ